MFSVFTPEMIATLLILLITVFLFAQGKVRSDLVAIMALLSLMLSGIITPEEALSGFSSPVVIMMISVFIIGGAIVRTGLAHKISRRILGLAGDRQNLLFLLIMLMTAAIGSIVSNTGTVAIMMPIVVSIANTINVPPSRFLMPLAFMSSMGGVLTLIGNTPNLVVSEAMTKAGFPALKLFSFFPLGVVCVFFGAIIIGPVTAFLLSRRKDKKGEDTNKSLSLKELAEKYHLEQNIYKIKVPYGSPIVGKQLLELNLTATYAVHVHEIRRKQKRKSHFGPESLVQIAPGPKTVIETGDTLHVMGTLGSVESFIRDFGVILDGPLSAIDSGDGMRFDSIGICELVILSTSRLVGRTVAEAGLREQYGVTLLGVHRNDKYMLDNLINVPLFAGDSLLVQGSWQAIRRLQDNNSEWIVVGRPLDQSPENNFENKIPIVIAVMLGMVITMSTGLLPTVTSIMLAAALLIIFKCFKNPSEAYSFINWESVVLIACMLPVSVALQKTGLIDLAARSLSGLVSGHGPYVALAVMYASASGLNLVISTTASALLVAPIAIEIAVSLGYSPYPFAFGVALAAGACFSSPFSSPANALVISAGRYTFLDYIKIGLPMQILLGIIMIFIIPMIYSF